MLYRQGSLACCSPWGLKESDTTETTSQQQQQQQQQQQCIDIKRVENSLVGSHTSL